MSNNFVSKVDVRGDIYNLKDIFIHSQLGVDNGIATLDENGKIPNSQLPSYVDDVLDGIYDKDNNLFLDLNGNAYVPTAGKIYIDTQTRISYRWSGSLYVEITSSLALGTTSSTAFPGDRGLALEQKTEELEQKVDEIIAGGGSSAEIGDGYVYVDLDESSEPTEEMIKTLETIDNGVEKKVYPTTVFNAVIEPNSQKTLDVILDEFTIEGALFVDDEPGGEVEITYAVDGKKVYYDNEKTSLQANNVQDALDEVFLSVSNGKELIASAITDKGIETSSDASFAVMAENISNIKAGGGTSELNIYFGLDEPEDKTKLWVKDEEPISCLVSNRFDPPEGGFRDDETVIYDTSGYYDDKAAYCNGKIYILEASPYSGTAPTKIPIYIFDVETKEISMIDCQNPSNLTIYTNYHYDRGFTIDKTIYFSLSTSTHIELNTIDNSAVLVNGAIGGGLAENSSVIIEDSSVYYCSFSSSSRKTSLNYSPALEKKIKTLYTFPDNYTTSFDLYCLNNIIYVFHGINVNSNAVKRTKLLIYDLNTNIARTIDCSLSKFTASNIISMSNIGHYIYLFQYNSNTVYKYNTITEELTYQEIPYTILNRQKMPIISIGSNLYLIDNNRILKFQGNIDIEELPLGQYLISPSFSDNIFPFSKGVINVDMGVEGIYKNIQDYDMISTVPIEAYLYNSDIGWYSIYND